jgi:hypothetical protein
VATDVQTTLSDVLGQLITFDADNRAVWPTEQLKVLHAQHLHAPLPSASGGGQALTFAQLLQHPHPPMNLLWEMKEFAKRSAHTRHSMLPPELCLVLYYGCITLALVRWKHRITRLSDDELYEGLSWAARQTWVDKQTRQVFRDGMRCLNGSIPTWR